MCFFWRNRLQSRRLLSVRWSAPEVLFGLAFSPASDVWSFAVVAWELLSGGMRPYSGWSDEEVARSVTAGFILPMPSVCVDIFCRLNTMHERDRQTDRQTIFFGSGARTQEVLFVTIFQVLSQMFL